MNAITYNIPARLFESYRGRKVILRSNSPSELVSCLPPVNQKDVQYAQLTSLNVDLEPLVSWAGAVPIDVLVQNPAVEYASLYNFSKLLDKHPLRASISVKTAFVKAVRLALALNFSVKLEVGQPDPKLIEEMGEVLDLYLHRSAVSQPVEYFHSTILSFFNKETPTNLWQIQEEDPEQFRFITDEGAETASARFGKTASRDLENIFAGRSRSTSGATTECDTCEFLTQCGGYFKWPTPEFDCAGVKTLFSRLNSAALELRNDLASFQELQQGQPA